MFVGMIGSSYVFDILDLPGDSRGRLVNDPPVRIRPGHKLELLLEEIDDVLCRLRWPPPKG
jgi:hypothetical protein